MKLEQILMQAESPARYAGGEFNTREVKPDAPVQYLLCFPDVYEVGMSNLGVKILYNVLNNRPDTSCEMCYAPWTDMAELMKKNDIELFSLTSRKSAKEFDIIGFSLSYEMSYTNIAYMLDLANIPLFASDRAESDPIIMGGGLCMVNPEPVAKFFDLISIGDGEEALDSLAKLYAESKAKKLSKKQFLTLASKIEGIYVPNIGLDQASIKRACVTSLDETYFPTKIQVANTEAIHNRAMLELFRGCSRGCRFCQAGFVYRPIRYRKSETLINYAKELIKNTGYDEISLTSLSTCDYPFLREFLTELKPYTEKHKVKIALPSTRVDSFEAEFVESSRKGSLTFAPEAGSQRLRDVINKNVTEEDILKSCQVAFSKGYSSIKLYFMIGLPTETEEDINGIIDLATKIKSTYREYASNKKALALTVSTSTFIPKPFTPFQWEKQISLDEIREIQHKLKSTLKPLGIKYSWHDYKTSQIESVLALGGDELCNVIATVSKNGGKYDGWSEHFKYDLWIDALKQHGLSVENYTSGRAVDSKLPWDKIEAGISKKFLANERKKAYEGIKTGDCLKKCKGCGIASFDKEAFNVNCKGKV